MSATYMEQIEAKEIPKSIKDLESEGYIIPDNENIRLFLETYLNDPECDKKALASACKVSRQTIYNWVDKLKNREPLGTKGKRKKYGDEISMPVAIRISESLYGELEEMSANEGTTLRQYIEDRLPYWVMGDKNMSHMFN